MTLDQVKQYVKGVITGTFTNLSSLLKISDTDGKMLYNGKQVRTYSTGDIIQSLKVPEGWLECDGSVYNISDYAPLAMYININFGRYDQFGGDGTSTFAVPNVSSGDVKTIIKL
jgi:hypothetical protein